MTRNFYDPLRTVGGSSQLDGDPYADAPLPPPGDEEAMDDTRRCPFCGEEPRAVVVEDRRGMRAWEASCRGPLDCPGLGANNEIGLCDTVGECESAWNDWVECIDRGDLLAIDEDADPADPQNQDDGHYDRSRGVR